jgi:CHAT domain-containing protein/tetratricopeptide (TPR) repeat protein
MTVGRLLLLAMLGVITQTQSPVSPSRALIDQGLAHSSAGRMDDAVLVLREAVMIAADQTQRGHALRALAWVTSLRGDLPEANALFDEALAAFKDAGNDAAIGTVWNQRGNDAHRRSAVDEAERYWLEALNVYRSIGDPREQAVVLRNLTFVPRLSTGGELALLDEALSLSVQAGDRLGEGLVRFKQGDTLFAAGNYAAALAHTQEAVRLIEAVDPQSIHLARALTSLGRIHRLQGNPQEAITLNRRAVPMLEAAGDFDGAAQALHALAAAMLTLGSGALEALDVMDEAIEFARKSRRPVRLRGVLRERADMEYDLGRPEEALRFLDLAEGIPNASNYERGMNVWLRARHAFESGRHAEALSLIDETLALARDPAHNQFVSMLALRAAILEKLGRISEAIDSTGKAVARVESIRGELVPADTTRQGYAEQVRGVFAQHIRLLALAGRMDEALTASEYARARAFVDSLAGRDEQARGPVRLTPVQRSEPVPLLAMRGATSRRLSTVDEVVADIRRRIPADPASPRIPVLDAALAAPPVKLGDITSASATLRTHFLVYWVGRDDTHIWVVAPDGRITSAKSAVGEKQLATLVRSTWASDGSLAARAASADNAEPVPAWVPALRGDGKLVFDAASKRAFRELDRLLLRPVRAALPRGERAHVTIVPHGPLFRLSFAPLISPAGRYLIEDARLSYTPSVAALLVTRPASPTSAASGTVVIADPELATAVARSERLSRLPGASAEGQAISSVLGPQSTTLLSGPAASESQVRKRLAGARIVHFATHGVIRDDQPMTSFLALGGSATSPQDDGRLTTAEVYELSLDADLVVLSACRSALGPVTGDGITGLTRAFFVAGSRSVMASLWDLPDVVTAPLLARFYREWRASQSKADALRRAQLHVIRELRAGRIAVDTRAGRFVVPEHPSLWAGLVLMGGS